MSSKLAVIDGPSTGTEIELLADEFVIGRDAFTELCLSERLVSRRHAVITAEDGGFVFRDLESRNGSFVNGLPVRERRLEHGDRIGIGASLMVFLERDAEPISPPNRGVELDEASTFTNPA